MSAASLIALYALKPPHEVVCKSSIPHLCPCSHLLLLLISGLNQPSTLHLLFYTLCSGSSHCRDPPAHYILTLSCVRIPNLGPELPLWSHWCWVSGQDRIIFAAVTEQREPPPFAYFAAKDPWVLLLPTRTPQWSIQGFFGSLSELVLTFNIILHVQGVAFALVEIKVAGCHQPISQSFRCPTEWLNSPSDYWLFPQPHPSHHQFDISCKLFENALCPTI